MLQTLRVPVTLIAFNRPSQTARVLARIRDARPATILVISDGPRPARPAERTLVAETRALIDAAIDWPCRVLKNYSDTNLGCMTRIQTGLDWVFQNVPESIILEDDCLPHPDFFTLCADLLARYRDTPRIAAISGFNLISQHYRPPRSYFFSNHHWIWGWATWRRAWRDYDSTFATWDTRQPALRATFANAWERQYWLNTFDQARRNLAATNSWAFQWNYTNRSLDRLTIIPRANLIENIGFTPDATHTTGNPAHLDIPVRALGPVTHPAAITPSAYADSLWTHLYSGAPSTPLAKLRTRLRPLLTP